MTIPNFVGVLVQCFVNVEKSGNILLSLASQRAATEVWKKPHPCNVSPVTTVTVLSACSWILEKCQIMEDWPFEMINEHWMHHLRSHIMSFFPSTSLKWWCPVTELVQYTKYQVHLSKFLQSGLWAHYQSMEVNEHQCNYCAENLFLLIMDDWAGINSLPSVPTMQLSLAMQLSFYVVPR